jgi:hypothetical protein
MFTEMACYVSLIVWYKILIFVIPCFAFLFNRKGFDTFPRFFFILNINLNHINHRFVNLYKIWSCRRKPHLSDFQIQQMAMTLGHLPHFHVYFLRALQTILTDCKMLKNRTATLIGFCYWIFIISLNENGLISRECWFMNHCLPDISPMCSKIWGHKFRKSSALVSLSYRFPVMECSGSTRVKTRHKFKFKQKQVLQLFDASNDQGWHILTNFKNATHIFPDNCFFKLYLILLLQNSPTTQHTSHIAGSR